MARVVQRWQEVQRRTWCWSGPVRAFAGLEGFFDAPALSGNGHQGVQRGRPCAVAAQVRVFAGLSLRRISKWCWPVSVSSSAFNSTQAHE